LRVYGLEYQLSSAWNETCDPSSVEAMLPASILGPGGMLRGSGRSKRRLARWRQGQGRCLQAHQQIGAHDQFPPALNTGRIGEPVISPTRERWLDFQD